MNPNDPRYPVFRIAVSSQVQNGIDNADLYFDTGVTDTDVENFKKYLREKGIRVPKMPEDERAEDVKKMLNRVWVALETLNCICELTGEDIAGKDGNPAISVRIINPETTPAELACILNKMKRIWAQNQADIVADEEKPGGKIDTARRMEQVGWSNAIGFIENNLAMFISPEDYDSAKHERVKLDAF